MVCIEQSGGLQAFYASHSSLCSEPDEPPSRPFLYSPTTPVVELDVDSAEMSRILPFLYLGNYNYHFNRSSLLLLLLQELVVDVAVVTSFRHADLS